MREKRTVQSSIFEVYAEHEIGRELKSMSDWLDQHPDLLDWVAADIKQRNVEQTGRKGLTIESVLRCAILKQYRQLSYEDLAQKAPATLTLGIIDSPGWLWSKEGDGAVSGMEICNGRKHHCLRQAGTRLR